MRTYEFDAIGTHWWLEILSEGQEFSDSLIQTLTATAEQFDRRYSRFRDDSLIAELARTGRISHPPAEMVRMLEFAREMYGVSGGVFDITVGNDLHCMGYGKRIQARDTNTSKFWDEATIAPSEIILPGEIMLDFGGFGKGWLIDQFARDMKLAGIREFIVNGGGDLYVESARPIEFALENPYNPSERIGSIRIARGALAGSNTLNRTWQDGDTTRHHIIDPVTHLPSESDVVASYVAASSALIADTMATMLIIKPDLERELAHRYGLKTKLLPRQN